MVAAGDDWCCELGAADVAGERQLILTVTDLILPYILLYVCACVEGVHEALDGEPHNMIHTDTITTPPQRTRTYHCGFSVLFLASNLGVNLPAALVVAVMSINMNGDG